MKTAAAFVLVALLALAPVRAQRAAWVQEWLKDYVAGQYAEVAGRLKEVASTRQLEADLEAISKNYLKTEPADQRRRELAAFALEAAFARVDQGTVAGHLAEWGCRHIRRITKLGEFEHRWHLAAFSVLSGAVDPDNLQGHYTHVKFQFPGEPRLPYERAVASELSTAGFFTKGNVSAAQLTERGEEAAKRYREAAASSDKAIVAEAYLHLGHVEAGLGRYEPALAALDQVAPNTGDGALLYLASLFRGQILERQGQTDAARQAYDAALKLQPGAHSATIALASMLFLKGDRAEADRLVSGLLSRTEPVNDPWWLYWPADFRYGQVRMQAMRQVLK